MLFSTSPLLTEGLYMYLLTSCNPVSNLCMNTVHVHRRRAPNIGHMCPVSRVLYLI